VRGKNQAIGADSTLACSCDTLPLKVLVISGDHGLQLLASQNSNSFLSFTCTFALQGS
jgi:hypothetical protein